MLACSSRGTIPMHYKQPASCAPLGMEMPKWTNQVASILTGVFALRGRLVSKSLIRARSQRSKIHLFVDGDQISVQHVEDSLQALRDFGDVTRAVLFAEPRRLENKDWKRLAEQRGITFKPVARDDGRSNDPNDVAISKAVRKRMKQPTVQTVALLGADFDYVTLAKRVIERGKRCIVILPPGRVTMKSEFENIKATVLMLGLDQPVARIKAVLQADGTGGIHPLPPREFQHLQPEEMDTIRSTLLELGYLGSNSPKDVLIPAIAKFWHSNSSQQLPVWPVFLSLHSLHELLSDSPGREWEESRRDLVFELPRTVGEHSKAQVRKYGTRAAAQIAGGGGPFVFKDSPEVPEMVLRRLGYLDDQFNSNMEEALLVFTNACRNKRLLRLAGAYSFERGAPVSLNELREVFLSKSCAGIWQPPPSDKSVRELLVSKGLLTDRGASQEDSLEAIRHYLKQNQLQQMSSYNGCVYQMVSHLDRSDPSRRR